MLPLKLGYAIFCTTIPQSFSMTVAKPRQLSLDNVAMIYRRWKRPILFVGAGVFIVTVVALSARFAPSKSSSFPSAEFIPNSPSATQTPTTTSKPATKTGSSCPITPPYPAVSSDTQGRYDWKALAIKHPVDSYTTLPTEQPLELPRVQHAFTEPPAKAVEKSALRRKAVKEAFQRCWGSYRYLAWQKDELTPISGSSKNTFGGWGATLVE
jgi:mannosyl-oligosaccharide alpha-1,2-mannosidase